MDSQTFSGMLDKVLAMFGRTPTQAMRGVCWDVCEKFPDIFADYAVEQARDLDRQPGNMSKFFRDAWFRWRESRPDMSARGQEFGCNYCHRGMIFYITHRTGYGWTTGSCVCGHCRPGGQTHENLKRFGCEIVKPGEGLSLCAKRNEEHNIPAMGENFTAKLNEWKNGKKPYERAVPDDERQNFWQ